jgi:hypothetical protein
MSIIFIPSFVTNLKLPVPPTFEGFFIFYTFTITVVLALTSPIGIVKRFFNTDETIPYKGEVPIFSPAINT